MRLEGLSTMKNFTDLIGSRAHNLILVNVCIYVKRNPSSEVFSTSRKESSMDTKMRVSLEAR
jgi:hypothetical protein